MLWNWLHQDTGLELWQVIFLCFFGMLFGILIGGLWARNVWEKRLRVEQDRNRGIARSRTARMSDPHI